jgi:hypothetical protein
MKQGDAIGFLIQARDFTNAIQDAGKGSKDDKESVELQNALAQVMLVAVTHINNLNEYSGSSKLDIVPINVDSIKLNQAHNRKTNTLNVKVASIGGWIDALHYSSSTNDSTDPLLKSRARSRQKRLITSQHIRAQHLWAMERISLEKNIDKTGDFLSLWLNNNEKITDNTEESLKNVEVKLKVLELLLGLVTQSSGKSGLANNETKIDDGVSRISVDSAAPSLVVAEIEKQISTTDANLREISSSLLEITGSIQDFLRSVGHEKNPDATSKEWSGDEKK